jgi:PAS domain S-box-containing protein
MKKLPLHIQIELDKLTRFWLNVTAILGAIFFLILGLMDYVSTPENFRKFFLYRIWVAVFLLLLFFVNNKIIKKAHHRAIIPLAAIIFSASAIELMILDFGGHKSPYYVGLIILIVCILGLIPLSLPLSLAGISIIYVIYLVPILLFDNITDFRTFFTSNVFLISFFVIAVTWRYFHQKTIIKELTLKHALEQQNVQLENQKKQLEIYSLQLKGMVEDRTEELHKSEHWHKSLFENATDGIIVLDRNGVIINANDRACTMHGFSREALVGSHIRLLEAGGDREGMTERMRRILGGESLVFEAVHNKKDGAPIHLEISAKAVTLGDEVFVQSFYRDITEKKKIQEHLFQSQKLESIGALAGGVAHDFNNILTAILGYTEMIRKYSEGNEKIIKSLNIIESAARKSGRMISQLLGFARKKTQETVPFNVNDVIGDTARLLERVIDKKISLSELLDSGLPPVLGDVNQMEQVIMNLIVNARDAMPNGGRIIISTGVVLASRGAPDIPPYIPEGRYVLLKVADTGMGIPPEVRDKIFEPFFTTKERGKGTGLGLSMVYGVIREHNGYITVQSEPNRGTTFSIYLPAADKTAYMGARKPMPSLEGRETILVVDDDESVLSFVRESLEIYGYRVLTASDPLYALKTFQSEHRKIDLVITDMAMPTMSGKELIHAIRAINPAARVLEISAYGRIVSLSGDDSPNEYVQKPFEARSLASAVRKILGKEPGRVLNN